MKKVFLFLTMCIFVCAACIPEYRPPVQAVTPPPSIPAAPITTGSAANLSRITHSPELEYEAVPSPDGRRLLIAIDGTSIGMITLGETGMKIIAGPNAFSPNWFPDGQSIIFSNGAIGDGTMMRKRFDGPGMVFITPKPLTLSDQDASVSPDGKRILFQGRIDDKENFNICTVNVDGTSFTTYGRGGRPSWHPKDNVILFQGGNPRQLFTMDLRSGTVTQLTSGNYLNHRAKWSPDGNWIVFVSTRDGERNHLFLMARDGSRVTQLTSGGCYETDPHFSIDGYIYFATNAGAPNPNVKYRDIWRLQPIYPTSVK